MRSRFIYMFGMLGVLIALAACSKEAQNDTGQYRLMGSICQDSTTVDSLLTLYVDNHSEIEQVELPVIDGKFSFQRATNDLDELILIDQHHHSTYLYATKGAEITLQLGKDGEYTIAESDSVNLWIDEQKKAMSALNKKQIVPFVDSLLLLHAGELRSGILLRDQVSVINDSVFVRRCMGRLSDNAKPNWLVKSIEASLDYQWLAISQKFTLPQETIQVGKKGETFNLRASRLEAVFLYFWADYDSLSVDSLQMLRHISRDYGLYDDAEKFSKEKSPSRSKSAHYIEMISICLHASDSAAWQAAVKDIPGKHCLLPGGFSNPLVTECKVNSLPYVLLTDRFGHYMCHQKTSPSDLYMYLNRTPINVKVK